MLLEKIGFRVQKWLSRFNPTFRLRSEPSSVIFIKIFQVVGLSEVHGKNSIDIEF